MQDFAGIVIDPDDGIKYSGIAYLPQMPEDGYPVSKIRPDEQYRPDKVSYRLYGRTDLCWLIEELNRWSGGIQEYTLGREFGYISPKDLKVFGIENFEQVIP